MGGSGSGFDSDFAVQLPGTTLDAADVDRGEERIEAARLEVERADLEAVQQAEESESAAAAVNLRHKEEAIHVVAEAQSTGAAELDPEVSAHIVGQREYACIAPLRYV